MRKFNPALLPIALAAVAWCAGPALAAPPSLGYVDTQKVFAQFKDAQSSQSEFRKKAEAYQKELLAKNEALQRAEKAGKSKAEIEKMTRQFEADLMPKKAAVEAMDRKLSGKLKIRIQAAIASIAAAHNISVVVDKQAVLFGGQDLTEEVLRKLNK